MMHRLPHRFLCFATALLGCHLTVHAQTVTIVAGPLQPSEAGSYPGEYVITRTGATGQQLTVAMAFGGTAVAGRDYEVPPASVTIAAGQASARVTIDPINDADVEAANDSVIAQVLPGSGYSVGSPAEATLTITNDDTFTNSAPFLYKVEADSPTSMVAFWTDNFQTETRYRLQYRVEGTASWTTIDNIPPDTTSYRISGLTVATRYEFRVTAFQNVVSSQTMSPTPKALDPRAADAPAWSTFEEWREATGLAGTARNAAGLTMDDPDDDRRNNVLEYLLGSDPLVPESTPPLALSAAANGFQLRWPRVRGLLDATLRLEESGDLGAPWQTSGLAVSESGNEAIAIDTRTVDRRFYRLSAAPSNAPTPSTVVTCWGDSLTGNPGTYVSKLATLLPGRDFRNGGIGGDIAMQILDRMVGLTITSPNPSRSAWTAPGTAVRITASRTTHARIMSTSQRGNWSTYAATIANVQKVEFFNLGKKIGESSTPLAGTVTSQRAANASRLVSAGHPFSTGDVVYFPAGPLPSPLVAGKTYVVRDVDTGGFGLAEADVAFTVTASSGTPSTRFVSAGHPFVDGDTAWFRRGSAPPGLLSERIYHVVQAASGEFSLAETAGGSAISMVYNSSGAILGKPGPAVSLAADFAAPTQVTGPFVFDWQHPGGQTALTLRTHTDRDTHTVILWMGRNNSARPHETYAELKAAIRHLKSMDARFLIVSVTNGGGESFGSPYYYGVINLNSLLRREYPGEFVDVRTALIRASASDAGDQTDRAADIPPRSLRSDNVHFNDAGQQIVAEILASEFTRRGW